MNQRLPTPRHWFRVTANALAVLIFATLSACVATNPSTRTNNTPPPETIALTYQRVSDNPQNTIMQLPDSVRVVVEADDAIYLFTKESHPAHSSYLYIQNIKRENDWFRVTTGYSEGDVNAFDRWLRQHQRHDGLLGVQ